MPEPNVLLWNAMLKGYSQSDLFRETLVLFSRMKGRNVSPNCFTFPFVLKSCVKIRAFEEAKKVHCLVVKNGCFGNRFIGTLLIDVYSGGGDVVCAFGVFDEMPVRNVVAWTSMISGYISSGDVEAARRLFDLAIERDVVLWNTMVSGYVGVGDMGAARKLFREMPMRDVMSWNTVLLGYVSNNDVDGGEKFFEEIPVKNVFSWNGMLSGYARNGRFFEVLGTFKRMLVESAIEPNDATLVTVLSACSRLGALSLGEWVHVYAESKRLEGNVFVGNGLIDMYSKCGSIDNAIGVFNNMASKDLITWNTLINGLAMHGRGADALNMFDLMMNVVEKPDGITFVGVLCACSHMGLVSKGFLYFKSMTMDYFITPQIEHYGCMVDLLARAGQLNEAMDFVRRMPIEADAVIWSSLLGACKTYQNVELAEVALEKLIEIEPKNPANFVLLSNIYGDSGRWGDLARLKVLMREVKVKKPPGCSLIEVDDSVMEFHSLDQRHPMTDEIYQVLNELSYLSRKSCWEAPKVKNFVE
ncbi:hypothetical protein Syun_016293 [Stephania yunnanensis]|uniref:Chlororespiratory reduction 4 n=1 Tax=Stephania yunnanensis TaxID=152371 RepID=A0AAP0P4R4_9MAGN